MQRSLTALIVALVLAAATRGAARAEWMPVGISVSKNPSADACAAAVRAADAGAALQRRRERWTYTIGSRQLAVDVAVRDDDFHTALVLDGLTYEAGRTGGVRWRADGNGVAHGVEADLQGDAADRAPQAVFRIDRSTCTNAGTTAGEAPASVAELRRDGDKPAFLFVDEPSGRIVREVVRDGKRVLTTTFDRFEPRARHWHVDDGTAADAIDVTVDAIEPADVAPSEVAVPARRAFGEPAVPSRTTPIDASFSHGRVTITVGIDGRRHDFILDTGTTSITVDPAFARRYGGTILEHCVLPHVTIGPLSVARVSALTVPFWSTGIIGLDFFYGHVVEIDYLHERVQILDDAAAERVFGDPQMTVISANVDQGLPLVAAAFGTLGAGAFAVDTGSPRLYVMRPFVTRFASQIAAQWTKTGAPFLENYLEGGIELQPYRVNGFRFAGARGPDGISVGAQVPTLRTDDLDMPFDGIIGTDILQNFDLFFDYDHGRIALRR